MEKNKLKIYLYKLFKILLLIAGLISIENQIWFNLVLVLITFFLIYLPKFLKIKENKKYPNKLEILLYILIYISIIFESVLTYEKTLFWFRFFLYFLTSIIIGIIGFSLIYILNSSKKSMLNLNPLFMALFSFCFSVAIGTSWQVFRHLLNYFFHVNIQIYNSSDAFGFLAINIFGAGVISGIGYIYLKYSEDNKFFKNIFKISKLQKNILKNEEKEILNLIKKGESEKLEFKQTLRFNINTSKFDKIISHSALKTVCAFLNTKGGILLVGVEDGGKIFGLYSDGFKNEDKFLLFFNNLIKKYIGEQFIPYINYEIIKISNKSKSNKSILKVRCKQSNKEVFLKDGHIEEFYIRIGPASILIEGSKLIEYIKRKF